MSSLTAFLLTARHTVQTLERWGDRTIWDTAAFSDDAAFLARFGRILPLAAQPKADARQTNQNNAQVEGIADRDQNGFESPFNELADGGDEILEVHGILLLARK